MLFNSLTFLVFIAILLPVYFSLTRWWQNLLLLIGSYVFYGWWDWRFLGLLAFSTVANFLCALKIRSSSDSVSKRLYLLISLITSLGVLCFFKYYDFFITSTTDLLSFFGMHANLPLLNVILPVGISFYTFQTMAYTIDVYRGKETATRDLITFSLYVSFFPQLVAGPIERSTHLMPQFLKPRRVTDQHLASGAQLILMGYFKKVFVADAIAPLVEDIFQCPSESSSLTLLLGIYLFAIQIYGDFAGYTDIARGVARILGFDLCLNFRQPYLSANITEFWRRWHISLSSWLRDYLYIPLGGNRHGRLKTYRNLMLTMLLGGLWHGAGWGFIVWGGLHGMYLAIHKYMSGERKIGLTPRPGSASEWVKWVISITITFHLVCLAWIFFRASNLENATAYLLGLFQGGMAVRMQVLLYTVFYGMAMLLIDVACWSEDREIPVNEHWSPWLKAAIYTGMICLLSFVGELDAQPFIYFQF